MIFLMPFFFLCLLEDSSPLSNSGALAFLPAAGGVWPAGAGAVMVLGRSGAGGGLLGFGERGRRWPGRLL